MNFFEIIADRILKSYDLHQGEKIYVFNELNIVTFHILIWKSISVKNS